ncbi:MAG: CbiQ family ECF transporter T component [Anaerovoracaceae bacterium]|jgi:energy-coupling factor transporter transmembrane protein EcfT/3',5'-cyclic AMP phosphodiesterase CpdA
MHKLDRVDPRAKIVMIIAISTAAMMVEDIRMLAGLLAGTLLLLLIGGVAPARQLRQARSAFGIVLFLFLIQAVFGRWILGAMLCLRLLILIMSALILMTGRARDYLLGLAQWKIPYEIVFMVMTGLHFFPILRDEARDVYCSIQLRGTEVRKTSLRGRLRVYRRICLPILAGAMGRARDLSTAMEARAFRARPRRTYMRHLTLQRRDWVLMIVLPLLCAGYIFAGTVVVGKDPAEAAATLQKRPTQVVLSWTGDPASTQTISWTSPQKSAQYVRWAAKRDYRARGDYSHWKKAAAHRLRGGGFRCSVTLTGLRRHEEVHYAVGAGRRWTRDASFTVGGVPADDGFLFSRKAGSDSSSDRKTGGFSFLSLGDVQYGLRERDYEKWGELLQRARREQPQAAFCLMTGDMVEHSGDPADWNAFWEEGKGVFDRLPLMTAPGNHETSIKPYTYLQEMALPENGPAGLREEFYSFDVGGCHFVSLNSNLFLDERRDALGEQKWRQEIAASRSWLTRDLQAAGTKRIIVFFHHPAYPVSEDGSPVYRRIRRSWTPILEKYHVPLVICGHQHTYMRTKKIGGVTYVMADSGFKPDYYYREGDLLPDYVRKVSTAESTYEIYTVDSRGIHGRAVDSDGKTVDSFTVGR